MKLIWCRWNMQCSMYIAFDDFSPFSILFIMIYCFTAFVACFSVFFIFPLLFSLALFNFLCTLLFQSSSFAVFRLVEWWDIAFLFSLYRMIRSCRALRFRSLVDSTPVKMVHESHSQCQETHSADKEIVCLQMLVLRSRFSINKQSSQTISSCSRLMERARP